MTQEFSMRAALGELEKECSRRKFFSTMLKGTGIVAAFDRFGDKLLAAEAKAASKEAAGPRADFPPAYAVFSALGNLVIPVDEDPGWVTFDPDITFYGLDVVASQVFLGGNRLAFQALLGTMEAFNTIPIAIGYSNVPFLRMSATAQETFYAAVLAGQFENDGVQDMLNTPALIALVSTKATFYSNFPRHLAQPGAEFQVLRPSQVKTAWDMMRYKGPVGATEEAALRERYYDVEVLPGVDPRNPYI